MGNSVLGGFKNMLKTYRQNLRKKKKNRWRLKSFIYSSIAIIIYPFTMFKNKQEEKKEQNLFKKYPKIYDEIKQIDSNLNKNIKEKKQENLADDIEKIKDDIKSLTKKDKKVFENKISKLEFKNNHINTLENVIKKDNVGEQSVESKKDINYVSDKSAEIINQKAMTTDVNDKSDNDIKSRSINYVNKVNKIIAEYKEKMKKISIKLSKACEYSDLYICEDEIKSLIIKFSALIKEYNLLKETLIDVGDIDKYNIIKNNLAIFTK